MKHYYLSEMNISDRHGGGLTLQRILGKGLDEFELYFQMLPFSPRFPTKPSYRQKEVRLFEGSPNFKRIGRFSKRYFAIQAGRILDIPVPDRTFYVLRYLYRNLVKRVNFNESKFLVVPQRHESVLLTNTLFDKHALSYVIWMMDDHVLRYSHDRGYYYPAENDYEQNFWYFLKNARRVFVISESMQEFYFNRFGIKSDVLFGPCNPSPIPDAASVEAQPGPIRLCYFGAVWKWQLDALEALIQALPELNARLDIFSFSQLSEKISTNSGVKIVEPVDSNEVIAVMKKYDGVIVPFGFSEEVRPLSELNISTKLSECLASGVPTVLVGPEYGAMIKFAKRYECAIIVSDFTDDTQIMNFKSMFTNEKRNLLLKKARWVAEHVTSTVAMQSVWNTVWENMSSAHGPLHHYSFAKQFESKIDL